MELWGEAGVTRSFTWGVPRLVSSLGSNRVGRGVRSYNGPLSGKAIAAHNAKFHGLSSGPHSGSRKDRTPGLQIGCWL